MLRYVKKYLRNSKNWFKKIDKRTRKLVIRLRHKGLSDKQITDYFIHQNLSQKQKKFCPLFVEGKKCHVLSTERLNCLGCYCPHYKATVKMEEGESFCGDCLLSSPAMQWFSPEKNVYVLDCSMCVIPHQHSQAFKILQERYPQ